MTDQDITALADVRATRELVQILTRKVWGCPGESKGAAVSGAPAAAPSLE